MKQSGNIWSNYDGGINSEAIKLRQLTSLRNGTYTKTHVTHLNGTIKIFFTFFEGFLETNEISRTFVAEFNHSTWMQSPNNSKRIQIST